MQCFFRETDGYTSSREINSIKLTIAGVLSPYRGDIQGVLASIFDRGSTRSQFCVFDVVEIQLMNANREFGYVEHSIEL